MWRDGVSGLLAGLMILCIFYEGGKKILLLKNSPL